MNVAFSRLWDVPFQNVSMLLTNQLKLNQSCATKQILCKQPEYSENILKTHLSPPPV